MASIPHMKSSRAVPRLLSLIRDSPVPDTVDADFLSRQQFADPRATLGVLRSLGFVGTAGRPTKRWTDSQDPSMAPAVLAKAIRSSYAPLFDAYPEAHAESDQALAKVLHVHTRFDNRNIQAALATFRQLCAGADFTGLGPTSASETARAESEVSEPVAIDVARRPGSRARRPSFSELGKTVAMMGLETVTADEAVVCLEHGLNSQACVTIWNAYMELVRVHVPADREASTWTPDRQLIDRMLAAQLCNEDEHGWLVALLTQRHACAHALGDPPDGDEASWYVEVMLEHIAALRSRTSRSTLS